MALELVLALGSWVQGRANLAYVDQQVDRSMKLNEIKDNPGSHKNGRRVGRGIGSGRGKTSGRGGKGQTARSGVSINGFEGGQMPLHRRLPKRGFNPLVRKRYAEISLGRLDEAVTAGRLDPQAEISAETLRQAGLIKRAFHGVRILGVGTLKAKLTLVVEGASTSARQAIAASGGTLRLLGGGEDPRVSA